LWEDKIVGAGIYDRWQSDPAYFRRIQPALFKIDHISIVRQLDLDHDPSHAVDSSSAHEHGLRYPRWTDQSTCL
jgi:hypothetical protein